MSAIKNVFISHIHEDDAGLEKLKNLVAKHGLAVRSARGDDNLTDFNKETLYE